MKRIKSFFACLLTAALLTAAGVEASTTGAVSGAAESPGLSAAQYRTDDADAPEVFFTSEISPEGLAAVYFFAIGATASRICSNV